MKFTPVTYQFSLFTAAQFRPTIKLKKYVSPERVREVQAAMKKGDKRETVQALRRLNDSLENLERRLTNKRR